MKKFLKTLFVLALLGGAGYYGYQYYLSTQANTPAIIQIPRFQQATAEKGNLSINVTGTGSVGISEKENVSLQFPITINSALVGVGEQVSEGQPLLTVDVNALSATIATLQDELDTCESEIAAISNAFSRDTYIRIPLDGRIKEVYIEKGQYIQDVMMEKGAIALISLDGWMMVDIPVVEGMKINDKVRVRVGRTAMDGIVREIFGETASISFSDAYGRVGQEIEVLKGKDVIGKGQAYIHMPYYLTTSLEGHISGVYMEVNDQKWERNRIAYLTNMPVSAAYENLHNQRERLTEQITNAKKIQAAGTVNSPIDGIVSDLKEIVPQENDANVVLASLYIGDQKEMIVSVDELDIVNVQVGQEAEIKMDAIAEPYKAEVIRVSQIGASESGVTVYDVTLSIEEDEKLRIGMNGTATIKVKEANDVLLVPIGALNSSREGQYVWMHDDTLPEDAPEPGIRTMVTTGLSDENRAEVLTGLNEGDVVMVTRESSMNNGGNRNNMMMMSPGMGTIVTMPGGGGGGGTMTFRGPGN